MLDTKRHTKAHLASTLSSSLPASVLSACSSATALAPSCSLHHTHDFWPLQQGSQALSPY